MIMLTTAEEHLDFFKTKKLVLNRLTTSPLE